MSVRTKQKKKLSFLFFNGILPKLYSFSTNLNVNAARIWRYYNVFTIFSEDKWRSFIWRIEADDGTSSFRQKLLQTEPPLIAN